MTKTWSTFSSVRVIQGKNMKIWKFQYESNRVMVFCRGTTHGFAKSVQHRESSQADHSIGLVTQWCVNSGKWICFFYTAYIMTTNWVQLSGATARSIYTAQHFFLDQADGQICASLHAAMDAFLINIILLFGGEEFSCLTYSIVSFPTQQSSKCILCGAFQAPLVLHFWTTQPLQVFLTYLEIYTPCRKK